MTTEGFEQRNPYKGFPPRPAIRVRLSKPADGTIEEIELLADTGNPCAIVVSSAVMARLRRRTAPDLNSNFGLLQGGWLRILMPELKVDHDLVGYANDTVAKSAKASDPSFEGLAGLPFLRLLEYGGDADWFWLRASSAP